MTFINRTQACRLHDPANHDAIGEHVEVVVVPFAGWDLLQKCIRPPLNVTAILRAAKGLVIFKTVVGWGVS